MAETTLWVVEKDGRVLNRGFISERAARAFVEDFVQGLERHRGGTKIRLPEFNIRQDRQYVEDDNHLWRTHKSHVLVTRP